jgi:hypothetical protein
LYETVTLLNIFHRRKRITANQLNDRENEAIEIAKMTKGLINTLY